MRSRRSPLFRLFLGGLIATGLVVLAILWAQAPNPAFSTAIVGDATIQFELNDSVVLSPEECVVAYWNVSGIRSVKFNNSGVIGHDQRPLCGLEAILEVEFIDGHSQSYRLERRLLVETLPGRLILATAAFSIVAAAFWAFPRLRSILIASRAPRQQTKAKDSGKVLMVMCVVLLMGVALRIAFINSDMRTDEAWTFNQFVSRPLHEALSDYTTTNNHLLHTLLAHLSYRTFGNEPWILRLPAFFAGVLVIALAYCVGTRFYAPYVGLLAAALVSSSSYMVTYSTNARGYTLSTACILGLLAIAPTLARRARPIHWVLFVLLAVAGLYTVPTTAFGFAIVVGWLLVAILFTGPRFRRARRFVALIAALFASALFTSALYLPTLVNTFSSEELSGNIGLGHLRSLSVAEFVTTVRNVGGLTWSLWNRDLPAWLVIALSVGFIIAIALHARVSKHRVSLPFMIIIVTVAAIFLQFGRSYARIWLHLLPLYFIISSAGLLSGLRLMTRDTGHDSRLVTGLRAAALVLVIVLQISLTAEVIASSSPVLDGETGAFEPVDVTLFLSERLQADDYVLCSQSCNQLQYYFSYYDIGMQPGNNLQDISPQRIFIVVVHSRQVIWDLLRFGVDADTYTEPQLVHSFPNSEIHLVERHE